MLHFIVLLPPLLPKLLLLFSSASPFFQHTVSLFPCSYGAPFLRPSVLLLLFSFRSFSAPSLCPSLLRFIVCSVLPSNRSAAATALLPFVLPLFHLTIFHLRTHHRSIYPCLCLSVLSSLHPIVPLSRHILISTSQCMINVFPFTTEQTLFYYINKLLYNCITARSYFTIILDPKRSWHAPRVCFLDSIQSHRLTLCVQRSNCSV